LLERAEKRREIRRNARQIGRATLAIRRVDQVPDFDNISNLHEHNLRSALALTPSCLLVGGSREAECDEEALVLSLARHGAMASIRSLSSTPWSLAVMSSLVGPEVGRTWACLLERPGVMSVGQNDGPVGGYREVGPKALLATFAPAPNVPPGGAVAIHTDEPMQPPPCCQATGDRAIRGDHGGRAARLGDGQIARRAEVGGSGLA
jgi:hypothetical protein